jgi:hypothetical protein
MRLKKRPAVFLKGRSHNQPWTSPNSTRGKKDPILERSSVDLQSSS